MERRNGFELLRTQPHRLPWHICVPTSREGEWQKGGYNHSEYPQPSHGRGGPLGFIEEKEKLNA